jgi:hypothetical protein
MPSPIKLETQSTTAFLLDAAWPEFKTYVESHHKATDILAVPIYGARWNRPQYAWSTDGFAARDTATLATLIRAVRSRHLATQGEARQKALLENAASLAHQLAKSLNSNVDEVCVSQVLLPFLWRTGALGGRRMRVLMTQLPMRILEATLDRAHKLHPESKTLDDFRAEPWILNAEEEALSYADEIITPHAQIASLFRTKANLLEWSMPPQKAEKQPKDLDRAKIILFPCSTLGRKGAYELRAALSGLRVKLLLDGKILESPQFWDGLNFSMADPTSFRSIDLVVQPSVVESQPRSLLKVLSGGVPVITTWESGLHPDCGAQFIHAMDIAALRTAISGHLN